MESLRIERRKFCGPVNGFFRVSFGVTAVCEHTSDSNTMDMERGGSYSITIKLSP